MVEETDRPNDFTLLEDPDLSTLGFLASVEVGGVADDLLSPDGFSSRTDINKLAILIFSGDNFVDGFVEHVGTTVDGRETCEGLGEFSKSIEGVNVGRLAVTSHGGGIHNDTVVGGSGGFSNVATRKVKRGHRDELWRAYSSSR